VNPRSVSEATPEPLAELEPQTGCRNSGRRNPLPRLSPLARKSRLPSWQKSQGAGWRKPSSEIGSLETPQPVIAVDSSAESAAEEALPDWLQEFAVRRSGRGVGRAC